MLVKCKQLAAHYNPYWNHSVRCSLYCFPQKESNALTCGQLNHLTRFYSKSPVPLVNKFQLHSSSLVLLANRSWNIYNHWIRYLYFPNGERTRVNGLRITITIFNLHSFSLVLEKGNEPSIIMLAVPKYIWLIYFPASETDICKSIFTQFTSCQRLVDFKRKQTI